MRCPHTFCRICEAAFGLVAKRDETCALVMPAGPEHVERLSGQAVMNGVPVRVCAVRS